MMSKGCVSENKWLFKIFISVILMGFTNNTSADNLKFILKLKFDLNVWNNFAVSTCICQYVYLRCIMYNLNKV